VQARQRRNAQQLEALAALADRKREAERETAEAAARAEREEVCVISGCPAHALARRGCGVARTTAQ
jgi:hypothetical protein